MPKASRVKGVVIHCTAGYGDVQSIKRYWKKVLKWRSVGYHRIVDLDGKIHKLADFSEVTNGVKGYNGFYLHIAYIGGVNKGNYKIAQDTRTQAQKQGLKDCITEAKLWLKMNGENPDTNFAVVGHRDFSKDKNGNGKIETWERIKECPSFDAIEEYSEFSSPDRKFKLPL